MLKEMSQLLGEGEGLVLEVMLAEGWGEFVAAVAGVVVEEVEEFKDVLDADLVGPFEGAIGVVGAEFHGFVDGVCVGGAFPKDKTGFVDDHTHHTCADHANAVCDLLALELEG